MKELKEIVRPCPLCGENVKYAHSPALVKFANGEDITILEGAKLLIVEPVRAKLGWKFRCPNCGKTWRSR